MPPPPADDASPTTSKNQPKSKSASTDQPQNVISFVSFDGSSSDANRKAVRKQAALASAAARKATIAKKNAYKRQDRVKNAEKQYHQQHAKPVLRPDTEEQPAARDRTAFLTEAQPPQSHTTRKRKQAVAEHTADTDGDGIRPRAIALENEAIRHKRQLVRTPVRYLTPPSSDYENDTPIHHHLHPVRSPTPPAPCQCLDCIVARSDPDNPAHLLKRQFGSIALHQHTGHWPFLLDNNELFLRLPLSPESIPSPNSIAISKADPFNGYPVDYYPIFDKLLHHMLTIFAPRGWPALKITNREGTEWEHFMTQHALAEPALFLVRLLFASGDLIRLQVLQPNTAVWLRSLAIQAINEALSDPARSLSDGMILAVGRIALTESLYGDRHAANVVHRPAQRRMIDLRGGMNAIDFPPLVKRLMRWSDRVMSIQSGTARLLPDDEDRGNTTFGMNESVKVLEDWVPAEGRAMRKKIAISDLIT